MYVPPKPVWRRGAVTRSPPARPAKSSGEDDGPESAYRPADRQDPPRRTVVFGASPWRQEPMPVGENGPAASGRAARPLRSRSTGCPATPNGQGTLWRGDGSANEEGQRKAGGALATCIMPRHGEVPEWPNGADSKSVEGASLPGVRIPPSPPPYLRNSLIKRRFSESLKRTPHNPPHLSDGLPRTRADCCGRASRATLAPAGARPH